MTVQLHPPIWERVMVVAPHPDDETLAAGGLLQQGLQRGAAVHVVFLTNGDNNPWPQRVIEHRWHLARADHGRWGTRRRKEALAALATLGIPAACATFLNYPDQGLTALLLSATETLSSRLAALIADWRPTLLVAPSARDAHPDHSAAALLTRRALAHLGAACPSMTELSYVIHVQAGAAADVQLPLSAEQQAKKRAAISCHTSQMVLSQRRFLAFVQETEPFFSVAPSRSADDHPVCTTGTAGNILRIEIHTRSLLHAFLPATLYMATNDTTANDIRYAVELPRRLATVSVRNAASGEFVTSAEFSGDWRRGELRVPLAVLPREHSVFVKLAHRHSFFDIDGWREIVVSSALSSRQTTGDIHLPAAHPEPVTCCVIPCYNVAALCEEVVRTAVTYVDHVIAVNDGSTDETKHVLEHIARTSNGRVRVLNFMQNRGKGEALLAAFRYALAEIPFDVLVTCDGDRQHRPADIPRLVQAWREEHAALVIGGRQAFAEMPLRSRLGNTITGGILRALYPDSPSDTQSGFRAHDRSFVEDVVQVVKGRRYETELDILLLALERQRQVSTVPIPTIYLSGNRSSHYRPALDSLRIYQTLLRRQLMRWWPGTGYDSALNVTHGLWPVDTSTSEAPILYR